MGKALALTNLQAKKLVRKTRERPLIFFFLWADENWIAWAVNHRRFALLCLGFDAEYIEHDEITLLHRAFDRVHCAVNVAKSVNLLVHFIFTRSLPLVRQADGAVAAQVNGWLEGHGEGKLGWFQAFDFFQFAGRSRLDFGLLERFGIDFGHEKFDGILGDRGIAIMTQDDLIRRLAGTEAWDLGAFGDLAGSAMPGSFQALGFDLDCHGDLVVIAGLGFDFQGSSFLRNVNVVVYCLTLATRHSSL